jgi:hypothetical protein
LSYYKHHLKKRLGVEDSDIHDIDLIKIVPRGICLELNPKCV